MFAYQKQGEYRASEWHTEVLPLRYERGETLVIWCHEHAASGRVYYNVNDAQACRSVAGQGLPTASGDFGGGTDWGKSWSAIDDLWQLMITKYGVDNTGIELMGGSGGGLTAGNYIYQNPTKVKAVALIIPAHDLAYHHSGEDAATGKYAAEIEASYGSLAAYQTALSTHSPIVHLLGSYSGPRKVWYSEDDIVVPNQAAYAAAINAEVESLGAVGHTYGGTGFDRGRIARWLRQHA